jgi:putative ABC transport system permease protein
MTALLENWRIALAALGANWFRALLTALGIVIGVASLIAVTAVSAGAQSEVRDSIRRLGGNVVKVDGEFISIGTRQSATDRTITPEDVAAIAKLPMVTSVAPHQDIESLVVSAGRHQTNTWLVGMTPAYAHVQNQHARTGRLISATDFSFGRSVMVLGLVPAERLFPGQNPIGKTVRVGSQEFEVIGVQARRGKLADENLDNRIFVSLPLVTGVLLGGGPNTVHVDFLVRSEAEIEPAMDAASTLLRRQHKLPASYPDDFSVEDQASIVKEAQRATTTFRVLTFALGGIALLVGGIGIMNMMLVSVHERTREIGIRKSVGADPWKVQAQFLIEAVVLSTLGGIAGVIAGIGVTRLISVFAGWQTLISVPSLVVAFLVALGVGLSFGFYPARRAARLDPIAALRYE